MPSNTRSKLEICCSRLRRPRSSYLISPHSPMVEESCHSAFTSLGFSNPRLLQA